jgi:hypothetical protein
MNLYVRKSNRKVVASFFVCIIKLTKDVNNKLTQLTRRKRSVIHGDGFNG